MKLRYKIPLLWRSNTHRYFIPISRRRRLATMKKYVGSEPGWSAEVNLEKSRGPWIDEAR